MQKLIDFIYHNFMVKAILLIVITAISYGFLINNLNLWSDEIYSVLMAKDSFSDMWELLSTEDSKPPLYYLYLKGVLTLFPLKYEIFGAHFASYILLLVAQIFSITAIRKDYGDKVSYWMVVILMLHPISLWLAFEVRTYILTSLLLLICLVYGLRLTRTPRKIDFIKFGVFSILALYSHYYAGIFLMFLYAMILFLFIYDKTFEKYGKQFLLTSLIVAIAFAPWLYVPLKTASSISKFWYVNDSFVIFSPRFFTEPLQPEILQSIFFIATTFCATSFSFVCLVGYFNTSSFSHKLKRLFIVSFGAFLASYLLLIILSYAIRPMVTARYLKTFSFIFYLAGAVVIANFPCIKKAIFVTLVVGFIFTYADMRAVFFDTQYQKAKNDITTNILKDKIIIAFDNANLFCEYYLPQYKCPLVVGRFGEILRLRTLLDNIDLYYKDLDENVYTLSLYNNIGSECISYNSIYRNGANVNLCKISKNEAQNYLRDSVNNRLYKYLNS